MDFLDNFLDYSAELVNSVAGGLVGGINFFTGALGKLFDQDWTLDFDGDVFGGEEEDIEDSNDSYFYGIGSKSDKKEGGYGLTDGNSFSSMDTLRKGDPDARKAADESFFGDEAITGSGFNYGGLLAGALMGAGDIYAKMQDREAQLDAIKLRNENALEQIRLADEMKRRERQEIIANSGFLSRPIPAWQTGNSAVQVQKPSLGVPGQNQPVQVAPMAPMNPMNPMNPANTRKVGY
jgi:hypothetical protein